MLKVLSYPYPHSPAQRSEAGHSQNCGSVAQEQAQRALFLQTAGFLSCERGEYDTAVSYLESALSLWTVLGNLQAEQQLFHCLGHCYWQLGRFQTAQCCYEEATTLAEALSRRNRLGKLRSKLGQIFTGMSL